jgi:hypothetical protein
LSCGFAVIEQRSLFRKIGCAACGQIQRIGILAVLVVLLDLGLDIVEVSCGHAYYNGYLFDYNWLEFCFRSNRSDPAARTWNFFYGEEERNEVEEVLNFGYLS